MSSSNVLSRIENEKIYSSKNLESLIENDELLCFKTESFNRPEAVLQKAREALGVLKEKESLQQEFKISSYHFAYLFAKFDSIYEETSRKITAQDKQGDEERELKQLLKELFKCEQLTHRYVDKPIEYPRVLVSLLEVLFDDYENLDALVLLLFLKFFNAGERDLNIIGPLHSKTLYFMSPFLKFFYQKNFDIMKFINQRDAGCIGNKIEFLHEDIQAILQKNNVKAGEKLSKNLFQQDPTKIQKRLIYEMKNDFIEEEDGYYEILGNLSLIRYLWCLEQNDPKISSAFLRIGITSYLFTLNDLTSKSATNISYRFKYFRALNNVELRSDPKFLSRSLQYILTELSKNKSEELMQMAELNVCVISCLVSFLNQRMYSDSFKETLEEYITSFLLPEHFAWDNLIKFVVKHFEDFSQRASFYVGNLTISENILDTWAEFACKIQDATFLSEPEEDYLVKKNYFPSILKIIQSIHSLIRDDYFRKLPRFIQEKLIFAASWYQTPDRAFISESDLFDLWGIGEKSMLGFLRGILEGSISRDCDMKFIPIFEIVYKHLRMLLTSSEPNFALAHKLLKVVYGSELIREIVQVYNEKGLRDFIDTKEIMGPFISFAIFLLRMIGENQSFLDEGNLMFLERFLEDLMNMDQSLISNRDYLQILSLIETMLSNTQILKQEKMKLVLLFNFSRFYLANVPIQNSVDYMLLKAIFSAFLSSESSNHKPALLFLMETLIEIYETKMRNPVVNLEKLFAKYHDRIVKKENEFNNKAVGGVGGGGIEEQEQTIQKAEEFLPIINEKRFQELKQISCCFCRKVTAIVFSVAKAILPQLEPFKEQATTLIKRTVKMGFSPLFMFASNGIPTQKFQVFSRDIITSNDEYLEAYLEGFFEGIIEICEGYGLHEQETMCQIKVFEVYRILVQNSKVSWVKDQEVLKVLTETEAALISFLMILDTCTEIFDRVYMIPEALDLKLRESIMKATNFILQISSNFYKEISQWTVNEDRNNADSWKELSKRYKKLSNSNIKIAKNLATIYSICLKQEGLKKAIKEVYENFWVNFEQLGFQENNEKFKLIYRCLMMKEFMQSLPDNYDAKRSLINNIVLNPTNLERILEVSLTVIEGTIEYEKEIDEEEVWNVWLGQILKVLQSIDVEMNKEEVQKVCFGQEENKKKMFEIISKTIEKLSLDKIINKNSKSIKSCLVELFMLFDLIHRLYFEYIEKEINPIKKKSMIGDAEIDDLEAAINDLESDGDGDEEEEIFEKGASSSSSFEDEEGGEEAEEQTELKREFKKRIKDYVEISLPYRLYVLDDIEEILSLADEHNAVPHDFWIKEYTKIYKSMLELFVQQASEVELKEKLVQEKSSLQGELSNILKISMTPSDDLDKICQLDLLLGHLTQFFVPAISDFLPLSINFIEGLIETLIVLLRELLTCEDLSQYKRNMKHINFPEIINHLINTAGNILIDFVVSLVSKNQCQTTENRIFLRMLDMIEIVLSVHQEMLNKLKWDFFDQNEDYFTGIVNLMNVILRANQSLCIQFLNKNLLKRLLVIQRVSPMNSDQGYSLMFLISTLLCKSGLEITEDFYDDISNLQEGISPITQRCIRDILEALLENYKFEESSLQLCKEAKKRLEVRKQARQEIKFTLREPHEIAPQIDETTDKGTKEGVYYGESFKEKIVIKETSSLVMLLASIIFNHRFLSSYILFENAESYRVSLETEKFMRNKENQMSTLDFLLNVLLWKNEDAVIFLVSSLIDSTKKDVKAMELFIKRILEIMGDLMESENERLGSLKSMLLRRNIGLIIVYLSNVVKNAIFEKKEFIQYLILNVTEKLLDNPAIVGHSAENSSGESSLLFIIKKIFEENKEKETESEETKKPYFEIVKTIQLESSTNEQQDEIADPQFDSLIFKSSLGDEKQNYEEGQKEETSKFCQLASLGEEFKNFIDPIKLPIDPQANFAQDFILKQSSHLDSLVDFCKALPPQNKATELGCDYLKDRMISNSGLLQGYEVSKDQTFNNSENFEYLPLLLRAKTGTIKEIDLTSDDEEKKKESEKKDSEPELKNDDENNNEENDEKIEIIFLLDKDIKSEKDFKSKFNKAVGKGRVLKEIICVEEILHRSEKSSQKFEQIISQFLEGMTDFEKNIIYLGLDSKYLNLELQEKIQTIKNELKTIKENFEVYEKARRSQFADEEEERTVEEQREEEIEESDNIENDSPSSKSEENSEKEEQVVKYEDINLEMIKLNKDNPTKENKEEFLLKPRSIKNLRISDKSILEACKLLFVRYGFDREAKKLVDSFLKDLICDNPANEIRVFDTLLFILYSPECLHENCIEDEFEFKPVRVITEGCSDHCTSLYEIAVTQILTFLVDYFEDEEKSYVFFIPIKYLNSLGNQKLSQLKTKTRYLEKLSGCGLLLDGIIGLLKTTAFSGKKIWITTILTGLEKILEREKNIKIENAKNDEKMTLENYEKTIFAEKILELLDEEDEEVVMKIQSIFYNMKDIPELFIQLKENLTSYFLKTIDQIMTDMRLENPKIQAVKVILSTFVGVFYKNIFVKRQNTEEISSGLKEIAFSLFAQEKVQTFFAKVHEMLDLNHKEIQTSEKIDPIILICLYQFSIIIMANTCDRSPQVVYEEDQEKMSATVHSEHQKIFESFLEKYAESINRLTKGEVSKKQNQALGDAMSMIIPEIPWIVDIDAKSKLLRFPLFWKLIIIFGNRYKIERYLENEGIEGVNIQTTEIFADRKNLLSSTMKLFKDYDLIALVRHLEINFQGETGIDGGGLRREFYELLVKELFNPMTGLFMLSDNKIAVQPNPFSGIVPNDLAYFQFAGIILAKAISDRIVVDLTLTKAFLKHILGFEAILESVLIEIYIGRKLTLSDLEDLDEALGKNMKWIFENDVDDLFLTQTHEMEFLGERITFELTEKGSEMTLDNANKKDYVKNVCEERLGKLIERQLEAFLDGFHAILPKYLISYLSPSELEVLIGGSPKIDLQEMKEHAILCNYNENNKVVGWFWEILEEFDQNKLAAFYYFISGSVKVPIGGFKQNFIKIKRSNIKNGLPIAHTCTYEIEIPEYDSKEILREKLLTAIFDGIDGFHIT